MKPYFVKWLPVEGDIEIGDRIEYESRKGLTFDVATKDNIEVIKAIGSNIKKVKLFLCSRDIQVGDNVIYLQANSKRKVISQQEAARISGTGYSFEWCEIEMARREDVHVKVIGEISPEATWVKEGDEFGEDEIGIERPFENYAWVMVKGPCGHFH